MYEHQGQQELLPQPEPEPVDIAAIAAQIGAVADAKGHDRSDPTDTVERRGSMADLRDGEDVTAEQGFALALGAPRARSGPGGDKWKAMREELDALPPGSKF